jgi:hypothetical protein
VTNSHSQSFREINPHFAPRANALPEPAFFFIQNMRHLIENKAEGVFGVAVQFFLENVGVRNGTWGENQSSPQVLGQRKRSSDITEATIERLIIYNQPMVFTF